MKPMFISFLCVLILSASTCKKEGGDCHRIISIKNNTNYEIIFAIPLLNSSAQCRLDGKVIVAGDSYDYQVSIKSCLEDIMVYGDTEEIFIVDPENYNNPNQYYNCDSIEYKNTVLKHYELSLQDLQNANWIITYP